MDNCTVLLPPSLSLFSSPSYYIYPPPLSFYLPLSLFLNSFSLPLLIFPFLLLPLSLTFRLSWLSIIITGRRRQLVYPRETLASKGNSFTFEWAEPWWSQRTSHLNQRENSVSEKERGRERREGERDGYYECVYMYMYVPFNISSLSLFSSVDVSSGEEEDLLDEDGEKCFPWVIT